MEDNPELSKEFEGKLQQKVCVFVRVLECMCVFVCGGWYKYTAYYRKIDDFPAKYTVYT
jgi:hypothetical protein